MNTQPRAGKLMSRGLIVVPSFGGTLLVYPTFLMKVLCFALFACAFNLLLGFAGPAVVRPCRLLRRLGLCHRLPVPQRPGAHA
jgi:hypothetical protein